MRGGEGLGQKGLTNSFSTVTSTNVEITPQKFLTLTLNPSATLVQKVRSYCQYQIIELELRPPLKKKWFSWSNPYEIEVIITSVIEMLELPNFGHMIT